MSSQFIITFIVIFIVLLIIGVRFFKYLQKFTRISKIEKIKNLIQNKKYRKAILKLNHLRSEQNSRSLKSTVHSMLGHCHYMLGDYSVAVVECRASIRNGNLDIENKFRLAKSLVEIGDKEGALSEYLDIVKQDVKNAIVYFEIGLLYYENAEYEVAYDYFSRAVWNNPKNWEAIKYKGVASVQTRKFNEGIECLLIAFKKLPSDALIQYALARGYRLTKDYKKAITYYTLAAREALYNTISMYELALCYTALGDTANAINSLEQALKLGTTDKSLMVSIDYELANTYERAGDIKKAVYMWESILLIEQDYKDVRSKLETYRPLRYTENIKAFFDLREDSDSFLEHSLKIVAAMHLTPFIARKNRMNDIIIQAREGTGVRAPTRIVFVRNSDDPVANDEVVKLFKYSKSINVLKSVFITCAMVSADTFRYATMAHIEVLSIDSLDQLLQIAKTLDLPPSVKIESMIDW